MGIRLKQAETAKELDDVFWVRRQVFTFEEGKFGGRRKDDIYLSDRFDSHPNCANLIAYEYDEPIATIRVNLESDVGLPPEALFDFSEEKARIREQWATRSKTEPKITSAGMLAVRKDWRRRRDVIRALLKLASTVGKSMGGTHVFVTANHENVTMYKRVGFTPVNDKVWVEDIGNYIIPMVSTLSRIHARTVGNALENIALLKCFSNQFQRMVFRAGEKIFSEFEDASECYVVDVGRVKITTTNAVDGRELVFAVLGPGEIFGEMALIDAKTRSADATAETDTEVIVLRREDFMQGLAEHPERLDIVLKFISDRLRRTDEFAKLLAYGSPKQRLDFALKGFLESAKLTHKADGTSILRAGPGELAAAAGTDERDVLDFLDVLRSQGYCEYTSKQIHFLLPYSDNAHRGNHH
ncbi:GNAT family N-acetyltransferase [Thiosocius teredinicola]|uniref:GNAT family N-acetyltransferase n=1 Tax=Thiosocius teredinicola TaxID=1973002 RepID=UPI0009910AB1